MVVYVWDAATGQPRFRIPAKREENEGYVMTSVISFSPDEKYLYTVHNHPHPVIRWTLESFPSWDRPARLFEQMPTGPGCAVRL
jgi:hypothetical protein